VRGLVREDVRVLQCNYSTVQLIVKQTLGGRQRRTGCSTS
jgi:hypothetical protein